MIPRVKCKSLRYDCFSQHDVDLERILDLRNWVTNVHEGQICVIIVTEFAECFSESRKIGVEAWVEYREIRSPAGNPVLVLWIGRVTGRRWRGGGKDNPLGYHVY